MQRDADLAEPVIGLSFAGSSITANLADGRSRPVQDVPAAVHLLRRLATTIIAVTLEPGNGAGAMAQQTAELAGMRLEQRGGHLYLLRPGKAPTQLQLPDGAVIQPDAPKAKPAAIRGPVLIALEPGLYNNAEAAFAEVVRRAQTASSPKRFHAFATATFLQGSTGQGRVNTLFRNVLTYGLERTRAKLEGWARFVIDSEDEFDRNTLRWWRLKVDPLDIEVLGDRALVLPYFRAWTLLRLASPE